MSSDVLRRIERTGFMQQLVARGEARRAWEAENPELARDWNAALEEGEWREREAKARAELEARRRDAQERAPRRLVSMGAPTRAVTAWMEGLKETPTLLAVRRMLAEQKTFCLLAGGAGTGKTVAAVAAMAERLLEDRREDQPVLFVRAAEGSRLGLYDSEDKRLVGQMLCAGVLVIDDLGAEFISDGSVWRSTLDEVIDVRYGERSPTVLTTNLDAEAFKARYGARISDRIRHAGVVESCGDSSLRVRGAG